MPLYDPIESERLQPLGPPLPKAAVSPAPAPVVALAPLVTAEDVRRTRSELRAMLQGRDEPEDNGSEGSVVFPPPTGGWGKLTHVLTGDAVLELEAAKEATHIGESVYEAWASKYLNIEALLGSLNAKCELTARAAEERDRRKSRLMYARETSLGTVDGTPLRGANRVLNPGMEVYASRQKAESRVGDMCPDMCFEAKIAASCAGKVLLPGETITVCADEGQKLLGDRRFRFMGTVSMTGRVVSAKPAMQTYPKVCAQKAQQAGDVRQEAWAALMARIEEQLRQAGIDPLRAGQVQVQQVQIEVLPTGISTYVSLKLHPGPSEKLDLKRFPGDGNYTFSAEL